MKNLILVATAVLLCGCARPTAGYSFNDLVWATSSGIREYQDWVAAEKANGTVFPETLCLAGIKFTASLAEVKSTSGSVGLPLAAPSIGLTGMWGFQFKSEKSEAGVITTSLLADYKGQDPNSTMREEDPEFVKFIGSIPALYRGMELASRKIGKVPTPPGFDPKRNGPFNQRSDLAAELWRIRDALHSAVLSSSGGFLLAPQPMVLRVNYTVMQSIGTQATVSLGGRVDGAISAGRGVTENNEMVLVYVKNESDDLMRCNRESFDLKDFEAALKLQGTATAAPTPPQP